MTSALRQRLFAPPVWFVAGVLAGLLVAPREHGSILIVFFMAIISLAAALLHLLLLLGVHHRYATGNLATIAVGLMAVASFWGWFVLQGEASTKDLWLLGYLAAAAVIASQAVYWLVIRPSKKAALPRTDAPVT